MHNEKSMRNKIWRILSPSINEINFFVQRLHITPMLAKILLNRGVTNIEDANLFLNPTLNRLMPNPNLLSDIDKAVDRIILAINNKEDIVLFSDYDVDGATSAALMYKFLSSLGVTPKIYIPKRLNDGYGLSTEAVKKIHKDVFDNQYNLCNQDNQYNKSILIITLDCGTSSHDAIDIANKLGIETIVVDHHLATDVLPNAHAIVNPMKIDDHFPYKSIAAVTVAFFVAIAVRAKLRLNNWFATHNIIEPDIKNMLDFVAIGTVCDVMPMHNLNRALIIIGLKIISRRYNIGLTTLIDSIQINGPVTVQHIGYAIGPHINAGGRMNKSDLGVQLLITNDDVEAMSIVNEMKDANKQRRAIERAMLDGAISQIENDTERDYSDIIVVCGDEHWHIGIMGIIAGKLKDIYHKPTFVIVRQHDGICKGSARSIHGWNVGAAIFGAQELGIIVNGGGHAVAGGFTINPDKIDALTQYMQDNIKKHGTKNIYNIAKTLEIDSDISVRGINYELWLEINKAAPFGNGNTEPCFRVTNAIILQAFDIKTSHVSIVVKDGVDGIVLRNGNVGGTLRCIAFGSYGTPLGDFLLNGIGKCINIVGKIGRGSRTFKEVVLIIDDVCANI